MTNPTDEESRRQRLRELHDAMIAKRRYDPPPEAEADHRIPGFEDVDDEHGHTVKRGISVWTPKAESDEWHRLRFGSAVESATDIPRFVEPGSPEEAAARKEPLPISVTTCRLRDAE